MQIEVHSAVSISKEQKEERTRPLKVGGGRCNGGEEHYARAPANAGRKERVPAKAKVVA